MSSPNASRVETKNFSDTRVSQAISGTRLQREPLAPMQFINDRIPAGRTILASSHAPAAPSSGGRLGGLGALASAGYQKSKNALGTVGTAMQFVWNRTAGNFFDSILSGVTVGARATKMAADAIEKEPMAFWLIVPVSLVAVPVAAIVGAGVNAVYQLAMGKSYYKLPYSASM